ncbi:DMT family transporter [Aquimarina sp. ERC-38]|uniref:DMT family transporter n=1 Tax=Aquimarina sp. ERC-38 TaxID=2949996 RepID=UPI0022478D28|nr:DMT family transporter [Aquimarina sp. ERC-38]UZO80879.1 DMT family transporter [Aquimarina sp. ERC-38]
MPNARITSLLQLHFIVFIWGFTAILGELITITAIPLVWYRMSIATLFVFLYLRFKKYAFHLPLRLKGLTALGGIIIAFHWITFFHAIKISNISITLAVLSSGAFFTSLLEPLLYKRKLIGYEVIFGVLIICGVFLIFKAEPEQVEGIYFALSSAILSSLFALLNGKIATQAKPSVISFYELSFGALLVTLYMIFSTVQADVSFPVPAGMDWVYIMILSSVCTACAFIVAVKVMKHLSPFTVMLTTNLEPIYGILLALLIFGDNEKMTSLFYYGALLIIGTVILNGLLKLRKKTNVGSNAL